MLESMQQQYADFIENHKNTTMSTLMTPLALKDTINPLTPMLTNTTTTSSAHPA